MSTTDSHTPPDNELKGEIILAMANELRRLRQQLLEGTDAALRPRRADEQHGGEMTLDSLRYQLDDMLRAREKERTVHAETLNSVVAELASLRKRYGEAKRALEAGEKSTRAQTEPSSSSSESTMDTDTETITEEDFKVASFLSGTNVTQTSGHLPAVDFYESPVGVNLWAALRKELSDESVLDRVLHPDIVIWQGNHLGARRCLLLYPSQRFTMSDKTTKAEGCIQSLEQGDTREIICKVDKASCYCGTYKCVGILNASEEDVNQLDPPHTLMNGIMQRTVTFAAKGGIPSHVGKLVREMYRSGTLTLRCYGMELVDRVEALDDALETCAIRRADAKRPSDDEEEGARKKQKSL